jgi:PDZ domain-containing protein
MGPAGRWRAPRWVRLVGVAVLVLVVAAAVADHVSLDYYVLTPGVARPVAPLVRVPRQRAHRLHGSVLLTDVYLTRVTALSYLYDSVRSDARILPAATVLGPATPPSQLVAQGYLEMAQSQSAAKAAALTRLGYHVSVRDVGVVVFAVIPGSPAADALSVGEVVTAVEGHRTPDACAFARSLASRHAGALVQLTVERSHADARAALVPGPLVRETVRLGRWPSSVPHPAPTPRCPGTGWHGQGFLGIEAETQSELRLPFPVVLRTTSIGGPSAGLAMTLGIINTLWDGNLTGGKTVAATGTITPTGAIGEVGGVPEKTVAVERAGATVFFVPAGQVRTARSKAIPSLRVYGVSSLAQVLTDLRHLGGSVPPTPPRHGS